MKRSGSSITSRTELMLLLLLILSLAVCYVSMLRSGHAWGDDFAMYLLHAQNIADGIPYSETGYVVNPAEPYLGPATYPPVFPVFLAGVQRVFGSNITYFKIATIILFLLGLVIVFYLTADYLDWPWRLSLVAVFGLNPSIWGFRDQVLSDLPFLLFTYLSLLLIQKAYTASTPAVLNGVGVGAAIYLAIGTREAGAVLLPTLLAYDVYKTRRISVFAITAVAVAGLLAVIQTSIHQGSPGQAALLDPSPQWMVRNTIMYAKSLRTFWLNGFSSAFSYVFYACTLGLTIWGVFRTLRHRIGVIEIFVVLYFGLIVVFSVPGLYRYLLPIIPLYLLYGLVGLRHAAQRLQWGRAALLTLFVLAAKDNQVQQ